MAQFPPRGGKPLAVADHMIEDATITVTDSNTGSCTLTKAHGETPYVTITKLFSAGEPHVNVFMTAVSKTGVTIASTYPFTGTIRVRAISRKL